MLETQQFLTISEVARECGVRTHRVKYAVAEFQIQPRQRADIIRLFSRDQLAAIREAVKRVAVRREVTHA